MSNVVIGAGFGRSQQMRVAREFITSAETMKRPSQTARPAGIPAIALLRALVQELAAFHVENAFLRRGTIAANQYPLRGLRMAKSNFAKALIAGDSGGVKKNRHVHHAVDRKRIVIDERTKILAFFVIEFRQGFSGVDYHSFKVGLRLKPLPAVVSGKKNVALIVNFRIFAARFQRL